MEKQASDRRCGTEWGWFAKLLQPLQSTSATATCTYVRGPIDDYSTAFFTVLAILGSKDQPQRMRIVQVSTVFKNCNSGYFLRMRVLHARLKLQGMYTGLHIRCPRTVYQSINHSRKPTRSTSTQQTETVCTQENK